SCLWLLCSAFLHLLLHLHKLPAKLQKKNRQMHLQHRPRLKVLPFPTSKSVSLIQKKFCVILRLQKRPRPKSKTSSRNVTLNFRSWPGRCAPSTKVSTRMRLSCPMPTGPRPSANCPILIPTCSASVVSSRKTSIVAVTRLFPALSRKQTQQSKTLRKNRITI